MRGAGEGPKKKPGAWCAGLSFFRLVGGLVAIRSVEQVPLPWPSSPEIGPLDRFLAQGRPD